MAYYQQLKLILVETLHLSKDGFHIILGALAYLIAARLAKRKPVTVGLIAAFAFALTLEVLDTRDALAYGTAIHWLDSARDIGYTMLLPIAMAMLRRKR